MSAHHDKTEQEDTERLTKCLSLLYFSWVCYSVGPCCGLCVSVHHTLQGAEQGPAWLLLSALVMFPQATVFGKTTDANFPGEM